MEKSKKPGHWRLQNSSRWNNPSADAALAFSETDRLPLSLFFFLPNISLSSKSQSLFCHRGCSFPAILFLSLLLFRQTIFLFLVGVQVAFPTLRRSAWNCTANDWLFAHDGGLIRPKRRRAEAEEEKRGGKKSGMTDRAGRIKRARGEMIGRAECKWIFEQLWPPRKELKTSRAIAPARWRFDFRVVRPRFRHRLAIPR